MEDFKYRSFYTGKPLHREALTHRSFYAKKRLHRSFCTQTRLHRSVYTLMRLHTEASTLRSFYTEKSLHRVTKRRFTHRNFYTQTNAFTHRIFTKEPLHREVFTHRGFCTRKPLHRKAFTHRRFYTEKLFFTEKSYPEELLRTDGFAQIKVFIQRSF